MTPKLRTGMRLALPSGNTLVLKSRVRELWVCELWVCEFLPGCKARGEVEFTGAYLRKWGTQI